MISMRRVGRPIGIRVMRRDEFNSPAVFRNAVKLRDKCHHVGNMFDGVARHDEIKLVVCKRIRNFAEIVNNIRRRARIVVQTDRAFLFICAAADIENFHSEFFKIIDIRFEEIFRKHYKRFMPEKNKCEKEKDKNAEKKRTQKKTIGAKSKKIALLLRRCSRL